jgi:iron(III) transport system permease protein
MPGLFAGGTIVFIWSFTELGTPLIMNYTKCASVQVFDALKEIGTNPFPYALVFVMLACSVALYAVGKFVFGRESYAMQSKAATVSAPRTVRGARGLLVLLPFALVILVALTPHLGVVATSLARPGSWYQSVLPAAYTLNNYVEALGHDMTVSSIRNSLLYSSLAVLFNTVLGIAIAFVVVRSDLKCAGRAGRPVHAAPGRAGPGHGLRLPGRSAPAQQHRRVKESPFWQNLSMCAPTPPCSWSSPTASAACPTWCAPRWPACSRRR